MTKKASRARQVQTNSASTVKASSNGKHAHTGQFNEYFSALVCVKRELTDYLVIKNYNVSAKFCIFVIQIKTIMATKDNKPTTEKPAETPKKKGCGCGCKKK